MARILMVEDSPSQAKVHAAYLRPIEAEIEFADTVKTARAALAQGKFDVVLLDLKLPDGYGLDLLREDPDLGRRTGIIVLTGEGSVRNAVDAMQDGALDFLIKPCSGEKLCESVRSAMKRRQPVGAVAMVESAKAAEPAPKKENRGPSGFLGDSAVMRNVFALIEATAKSSASVFITGESGTGKELCAQAIHNSGPRRNGPLVPLNCAAIPQNLMESEIFGHRKGSFTGAFEDRGGAASEADGGSLFLDEVCEMDIGLQVKLLRFIQTGNYKRIGDTAERPTDIRFICATNRDPLEEVRAGRFREDLYYRLHVISINMPPLRERGKDIRMLAERFLRDLSGIEDKVFETFSAAALKMIESYDWPGNVRQLENLLRNVVVLNDGNVVEPGMFPPPLAGDRPGQAIVSATENADGPPDLATILVRPLEELEMLAIDTAIESFGGNVSRAARALDISTSTIYRKKQAWEAKQKS